MTTLNTVQLQPLADAWDALAGNRGKVRSNPDLNDMGKYKAVQKLNEQKARLVAETLEAVRTVDQALRRDYLACRRARGAALQASRSRWGREGIALDVQNEIDRAQALIQRGNEVEIRSAWESVRDSYPYVYAWWIACRDNLKAGTIRADVLAEYAYIEDTMPEMTAVTREGAQITKRGADLRADIVTLMGLFGAGGFDPATAELQNIMARLGVTRSYDRGAEVVHFAYIDSPADGFTRGVVDESQFNSQTYAPAK